jgi:predicted RNase H-like nuclease (RuvC/YqgF family)
VLNEFERYKEASYENISELQKKMKNLEKTIVSKDKEISRMKSETENSDTEYRNELQSEFMGTQSSSMVDDLRSELRNKNPAEYRVLKMDSNWDSIDPTVVVYRRASHNSSVIE